MIGTLVFSPVYFIRSTEGGGTRGHEACKATEVA